MVLIRIRYEFREKILPKSSLSNNRFSWTPRRRQNWIKFSILSREKKLLLAAFSQHRPRITGTGLNFQTKERSLYSFLFFFFFFISSSFNCSLLHCTPGYLIATNVPVQWVKTHPFYSSRVDGRPSFFLNNSRQPTHDHTVVQCVEKVFTRYVVDVWKPKSYHEFNKKKNSSYPGNKNQYEINLN